MAEKKEFVDREAVLATAFETLPLVGTSPAEAMGISRMSAAFYRAVRNIPAADVAPVRHGRWIDKSFKGLFGADRVVQCSICKNVLDMDGVNAGRGDANFCPNCGAKMDGGVDDAAD